MPSARGSDRRDRDGATGAARFALRCRTPIARRAVAATTVSAREVDPELAVQRADVVRTVLIETARASAISSRESRVGSSSSTSRSRSVSGSLRGTCRRAARTARTSRTRPLPAPKADPAPGSQATRGGGPSERAEVAVVLGEGHRPFRRAPRPRGRAPLSQRDRVVEELGLLSASREDARDRAVQHRRSRSRPPRRARSARAPRLHHEDVAGTVRPVLAHSATARA